MHPEIIEDERPVARTKFDDGGQAIDRHRRNEAQPCLRLRWITPNILRENRQTERFSDADERGPDRFPSRRWSGHEIQARLDRQFSKLIRGKSIDRGLEPKPLFAVGLQAKPGRALSPVAQSDRERIAGTQIAAADTTEEGVRKGPDVEPVEPDLELCPIACLDSGEIRRGWLRELRLFYFGGCAARGLAQFRIFFFTPS